MAVQGAETIGVRPGAKRFSVLSLTRRMNGSQMDIKFRCAAPADLPAIVKMLCDDPLGATRERFSEPLPESYTKAFKAIAADPNNELIVATRQSVPIGVMQITFIPYLTFQGQWRAMVEGVRVHESHRGKGVGRRLIQEAVCRAEEKGCRLIQLTTDKKRPGALRFYESLGFIASHEGLKLHLNR